jgi:uncharacterized membrane protein
VGYLIYAWNRDPFWFHVGLAANVGGVIMALITAIPGFLDWALGIPSESAAKRTGVWHMLLNVSALVVFAVNAWLHIDWWYSPGAPNPTTGIVLALIGILITLSAGWLGWTLVQHHHVGIEMTPEQAIADPANLRRVA